MVRRAARVDPNQGAIVEGLRAHGFSVQTLAAVGGGVPDLLVGAPRVNVLLEVKSPPGPAGGTSRDGQRLSKDQERWHGQWMGPVYVVTSIYEALEAMRLAIAATRR